MLNGNRYWVIVVAITCALAAGCRSPSDLRARTAKTEPPPKFSPPPFSDRSLEKAARAHAHYAAGVIHEMNDELGLALEEYYQAALGDPDNESLVLEVSRRFLQNKQPEKALELLAQAAARPDASGAILARLGLVYSQLGKTEQAIAADRLAIKKAPKLLAGYHNLFLNYLQNKQPQEALKVLDDAAAQRNADADFLITLSELYANLALQVPSLREKVTPKALAVLDRADKLNPTSPSLRIKLADGYYGFGNSARAAQIYLDLLKRLADVPLIRERVHAKLAEIYLRGSDRTKAVEQLKAIIHDDPTNPQAYYYLGTIAFDEKKPAEAADYLSKAILLSPEFEPAYYDLASAQINLNKTSDALDTLAKARRKFGQNFGLEMLTGMAFTRQKAYTEAIQHFTAAEVIAKATDPKGLSRVYFQLGAACERKGDLAQAEEYFQKCLQLAPDSAEAMNYLGYMWAEHDLHLNQARELIEKALKIQPNNAAYLDSLGWVLFKLNQPRQALDHILKAAELSEEADPVLYDHLGDIYAALKQMDKAAEAWKKALSIEPNDDIKKDDIKKKLDAASRPPP